MSDRAFQEPIECVVYGCDFAMPPPPDDDACFQLVADVMHSHYKTAHHWTAVR